MRKRATDRPGLCAGPGSRQLLCTVAIKHITTGTTETTEKENKANTLKHHHNV